MSRFGEILSNAEYAGKNNLSATVNPTATDDSASGYEVGSIWVNTTVDGAYICLDASIGAAIWAATTASVQDTTDSTGVLTGGVLSVGTGGPGVATTFSISDGTGQRVTNSGVITDVSWSGLTDQPLSFLATNLITFIAIDSVGAIVQQTSPFTPTQARDNIVLGVVVHVNFTTVDTVNNEQHISYNVMSSLYDAIEAIGFFNKSGNVFSANGANLNINKSVGIMFKMGSNYDTDVNNPHERTLAALNPAQFQYRFSDGTSGILTETNIDPNNLDDGAGGLTAISANRWSIQRIYVFTSNNVKIQRGVSEYSTQSDAIAGIATEPYVTEPSIAANGLLRGWLIVKQGATALNGADALFLSAPKFGEGNAGATGSPIDLQEAYDNSTADPEILTNATGGAVTIRRGSAADTDKVLQTQNGGGTETFGVTGEGKVNALDYNGVALTTAGLSTKYLDEQGNYTVPSALGNPKFTRSFYSYNFVGASGTWNGTTVSAGGASELNDRWRVVSFAGTGGADGFYVNMQLPNTYTAGNDIKVTLQITTLAGGTGNAHFEVGICDLTVGGALGNSTEDEWLTADIALSGTGGVLSTQTFTFDGTNFTAPNPLSIMFFRDPGNGGDTSNDTTYLTTILIEEV